MTKVARLAVAVGVAALAVPAGAHAKKWLAPAEARARKNPVPASAEAVAGGRPSTRTLRACHGSKGKGDGPDANPATMRRTIFRSRVAEAHDGRRDAVEGHEGRTEGGHVVMPGFAEDIPSESDRWKVVHYVRSLVTATAPSH